MSSTLEKSVLVWLLGLRWIVVIVLLGSLPASSMLLDLPVDYPAAVAPLAVLVTVNLTHRWIEPMVPAAGHGYLLLANAALDVIAIAICLAASGGAANPFSSLLLVYVALGASLLAPRRAFALAALSACTFGALFLVPGGAACPEHPIAPSFSNHLYGMWVAFALGASLVAFFLTRVRRTMEEREREVHELRVQSDKFAAIATLAAGTARELGTPLATIRVLATELREPTEGVAASHARRIEEQIDRCVRVLDRMRPGTGGEALGETDLGESLRTAVASWRVAHPDATVQVDDPEPVRVPLGSADLEAAIMVLLDNALSATREANRDCSIRVRSGSVGDEPFVSVDDDGVGLAPEAVRRAGDPFFTTKPPGAGMGLGLFVVRSLLHRIGGRLEVESREPTGTSVRLLFGSRAVLRDA